MSRGLATEGQLSGQWVMEEWLDDVMKDRLVMDIQHARRIRVQGHGSLGSVSAERNVEGPGRERSA